MAALPLHALAASARRALREGIARFNRGQFWEAHEAWEEAWQKESGTARIFLQGLIQLAAACHKGLCMGSPRGMAMLFERAGEKLARVAAEGSSFAGMELEPLLAAARAGEKLAMQWERGAIGQFDRRAIPVLLLPDGTDVQGDPPL